MPHFGLKKLFDIQQCHLVLMTPVGIMLYNLQKHTDVLSHLILIPVLRDKMVAVTVLIGHGSGGLEA